MSIKPPSQVIHHDAGGDGGVEGFGAAAHGEAEAMGGLGLDGRGDSVAFVGLRVR